MNYKYFLEISVKIFVKFYLFCLKCLDFCYNWFGDKMNICVLGSGAYGSALAIILNENKNNVYLWSPFKKEIQTFKEKREPLKLPGVKLDEKIIITNDIEEATKDVNLIVLAIPTAFVRSTLKKIKKYIKDKPICIASKGIEQNTCAFVNEIIQEELDTNDIAVISGPSFAIDVANKVPVGLTLACKNKETTDMIYEAFSNAHFKLRICSDIIGTEVCGAIKNVIAIASGMLAGMKLPESTSAMLITESVHDIKDLIKGLGGDGDTISSFAGFGDLLLTATSTKSRNFSFGLLVGSGASREEIDNYINNTTIEGLYTLTSIKELLTSINAKMPIVDLLHDIIYEDKKPKDLIRFLVRK